MHARGPHRPVTLVSFSGIDGAGKSTQINALCQRLKNMGMNVRIIRFWDDVSKLKTIRESTGHKLFRGDKGVGTPEAPITRKDKNIQSWSMTCVRLGLYFSDALSARRSVNGALRSDADVVIFDRYCYDELANLNLHRPLLRTYVAQLLKIVPTLDRSYLLDADPLQARKRKPEYPIEFVYQNRAAYLQMQQLTGRMTVIEPSTVEEVGQAIWRHTLEVLRWPSNAEKDSGYPAGNEYRETDNVEGPPFRPAA
jgi:thymidylate kinase